MRDSLSALGWILIWLAVAGAMPLQAADTGYVADYIGGTMSQFGDRAPGKIHLSDPEVLVFEAKRVGIEVPYDRVNLLEYGQQTGRRIVLAIAISPLLLLTKSRRHFLTLSFKDEAGKQQAMVFQIDKKQVRAVLAGLEARTGLKVGYLDDEARRVGGG